MFTVNVIPVNIRIILTLIPISVKQHEFITRAQVLFSNFNKLDSRSNSQQISLSFIVVKLKIKPLQAQIYNDIDCNQRQTLTRATTGSEIRYLLLLVVK